MQKEVVPVKEELDSYLDLTPVIIFHCSFIYAVRLTSMDFKNIKEMVACFNR